MLEAFTFSNENVYKLSKDLTLDFFLALHLTHVLRMDVNPYISDWGNSEFAGLVCALFGTLKTVFGHM